MRTEPPGRLRLALPKGRVLPDLQRLLGAAKLEPIEDLTTSRRLVIPTRNGEGLLSTDLEILLLKNSDVPIYVEHGVADLGVSGTDLLYETGVSVLRPYTFDFGRCQIVVAGKPEHDLEWLRRQPMIDVATKYVRFARDHFARLGWPVAIIPLAGSVELAPVLGLADAIVDLMETGSTLRENGLVAHDVVGETSLKLIVNRALSRAKMGVVERLIATFGSTDRAGK